jgi:hypothetical protein
VSETAKDIVKSGRTTSKRPNGLPPAPLNTTRPLRPSQVRALPLPGFRRSLTPFVAPKKPTISTATASKINSVPPSVSSPATPKSRQGPPRATELVPTGRGTRPVIGVLSSFTMPSHWNLEPVRPLYIPPSPLSNSSPLDSQRLDRSKGCRDRKSGGRRAWNQQRRIQGQNPLTVRQLEGQEQSQSARECCVRGHLSPSSSLT